MDGLLPCLERPFEVALLEQPLAFVVGLEVFVRLEPWEQAFPEPVCILDGDEPVV